MRSFSSVRKPTAKHLAILWLLALFTICDTTPVAANNAEKSKTELNALKKKIDALNKELNSSQAAHKDAADELKDSEKAISEANRKLHELTQQEKKNRNRTHPDFGSATHTTWQSALSAIPAWTATSPTDHIKTAGSQHHCASIALFFAHLESAGGIDCGYAGQSR